MNKTTTTVITVALTALGVFIPIIPIEVHDAKWTASYEVTAYNTSNGLLADDEYAIDEETYMVRGEEGLPTRVEKLTDKHTKEVQAVTDPKIINLYERKEEKLAVISDDKIAYDKLRTGELKKPKLEERESIIEKIFEPTLVEAVILPDGYSFSQSSAAVQTVTFAHTVTTSGVLTVGIGVRDTGLDEPIQVTYNSVDLTKYTSYASTTLFNASVWYLVSPSTGTNNIFVDFAASTGTADNHAISAQSLTGTDTSIVFNASSTASGVGTSSISIAHTAGSYGLTVWLSSDSTTVGNTLKYYDTLLQNYDSGAYTFWNSEIYVRYASSTLSVNSQEGTPNGVALKTDGTEMYVVGHGNDAIYQYTCSTPWAASSCTYATKSCSVTAQDGTPQDLFFKSDGTKAYILGSSNDLLYQYSLGTAWDISTCSYDSVSTSTTPGEGTPSGLFFTSDGARAYVVGTTQDSLAQFSLSIPWDISTLAFVASTTIGSNPSAVSLSDDGQYVRIMRPATAFSQYRLSTAYNVSTLSLVKQAIPESFLNIMTSSGATGAYWKDFSKVFISDNTNNTIYEYAVNETATTTTTGVDNPGGVGDYIQLTVMISPASDTPATSTSIVAPFLIWEE